MPMEWLIILQEEKPLVSFTDLQTMTPKEVNDVLEVMQMRRFYELENMRMRES